jgi:hypothetical protein
MPEASSGSECALGFVAKTGRGVAVAVSPGPVLLGKWGLLLVPPGQERFVYHAAQEMDDDAEEWVRRSLHAINRHTQDVITDLLADVDANVTGAAIVGTALDLSMPLAEILGSHNRLHAAEGACYRSAIAEGLHANGLEPALVAPATLGDHGTALDAFGKVPSPWRREHKDAALAAISLFRGDGRGPAPRTPPATPRRRKR